MPGFQVSLTIDCARPPRQADLAFLGPAGAKVQPRGKLLDVHLDVEAGDVVEALAHARDLVLGGIDGDVWIARVAATDSGALPPRQRPFWRRRS